jgi:hypothetical protein
MSAVAFAAAMVACLAFAPLASAAENPVATGSTTTVTLNGGLFNKLKKAGVKVQGVSPATAKGKTVTIPVEALGSKFDPATNQGVLFHEGGIKFKKGKKTVSVTALELSTATSSLTGKLGGKVLKVAAVSGVSSTRVGFGSTIAVASMKLTGKAAKELNKKLGFTSKKKKKKGGKKSSASASKKKKKKKKKAPAPFKGNQVLGGSSTAAEYKTVGVQPTGVAKLNGDLETLSKFAMLGALPTPIAPTTIEPPATFLFPISGGSVAPNGLGGVPQTAGGVKFTQEPIPTVEVWLTMANIWVDLGSKKATAEVSIEDNQPEAINTPGALGRVSVANIVGGTVTSDPNTKQVTVAGASAVIDGTTAFTLNESFAGGMEVFKDGDSLGTFDFTAQGE